MGADGRRTRRSQAYVRCAPRRAVIPASRSDAFTGASAITIRAGPARTGGGDAVQDACRALERLGRTLRLRPSVDQPLATDLFHRAAVGPDEHTAPLIAWPSGPEQKIEQTANSTRVNDPLTIPHQVAASDESVKPDT